MNDSFLNKTELKERGWTDGAIADFLGKPDKVLSRYGGGKIHCYDRVRVIAAESREQFKAWEGRRKGRRVQQPQVVDLLAAIFTVNRAAKRCRDAAQSLYQKSARGPRRWRSSPNLHGLAQARREQKETLYELKDCGIAVAFNGTATGQVVDEFLKVESKPKGRGEMRLKDAMHTLQKLPVPSPEHFKRMDAPRYSRASSTLEWDAKWPADNDVNGADDNGAEDLEG